MKYLIVEDLLERLSVIVFDDDLIHLYVAAGVVADKRHRVAGAGMCRKVGNKWEAYGESDSLGINSDPDRDSILLNLFLLEGLSGLDLQNHLTLLEIEAMKREGG